jgi:hypothetical protein
LIRKPNTLNACDSSGSMQMSNSQTRVAYHYKSWNRGRPVHNCRKLYLYYCHVRKKLASLQCTSNSTDHNTIPLFGWAYQHGLSAVEQCFSLTANQPQPAYKPKSSLLNRANSGG